MWKKQIEVEGTNMIHPHGEVIEVRRDLYESSLEANIHLVVGAEDRDKFFEELQQLIERYAI